ncbi:MAG TPA: hypothetical protein VKY66_01025, partial [Protaetiibacter sp.]|nr:hypothetical protein [Protaetiibacter sp.]
TPAVTTPTDCAPPTCLITGLSNGTSYQFSVQAINEHGPGEWSAWSTGVIPYGTPETPRNVALTLVDPWTGNNSHANTGAVSASWAASGANGGTVHYEWQLYRGGSAVSGKSGSTTTTSTGTISGLGAGSYTVRVTAVNSGNKRSTEATSTAGSVTLQTVPNAPGGLTPTVLDGDAPDGRVRWNWNATTASTGGAANLSYQVSFNNGSWQDVGTALSWTTAANLGQGSHSLRVRAVNKAGAGAEAGPSSVSIAAEPRNPSVRIIGKGANNTCSDGGSGCRPAIVQFSDTGGTYTIQLQAADCAGCSWRNVGSAKSVSGSGQQTTWGLLGVLPVNSTMRVIATGGPDGTLTSQVLNRDSWGAMPHL